MIESSKPRNQRFFRYNAPMHERQKFVHAHVDKQLREKLQLKRRAVQLARGDTIKIMSGGKRGQSGKVTMINMKTGKIYIDSIKKKNAKGKEFNVPISCSNVYITDLNLSDKVRADKLKLKYQPAPKTEMKEAEGEKSTAVIEQKVRQPTKDENRAKMELGVR